MNKLKKFLTTASVGLFCFTLCGGVASATSKLSVKADAANAEWTGSYNVYGGESSRIGLPIKLNGNTVKSFTIDGVRLSNKDYTISDDTLILEPRITTKLGRGGYVAKLTTSDGAFHKFILYVGVNEGEGILLDFDVNVYTNESDLFVPSTVKYALEDESLCFDGKGGTLFGFDKNGQFGFYKFKLKPETRYQLDFDFRFYDDMTMDWLSIIFFNGLSDMVGTLQMDNTVTLDNNAPSEADYIVTNNEDGSKHIHFTFVTPEESQCNGLYFNSSVEHYLHMDMDNILLIPYVEEPLSGGVPMLGKLSAETVEIDVDETEKSDYATALRMYAEVENAFECADEVGFEVTLPDGSVKTLPADGVGENGQYAIDLLHISQGTYRVRSYLKYTYYGESFAEKSGEVIVNVGETEEETAEIYIIAGQSNAYGSSPAHRVTLEDTDVNNAVMFFPASFGGSESRQNVNFLPVTTDSRNFENKGAIGPESGFSHTMYKANGGKKIYIIKLAQGGSELHDRWASPSSGNSVTPGKSPLYSWLIETVQSSANYFKAQNITPEVKGFLWMQGESDCQTAEMADAYERNLNIFFDDILSDFSRIWESDLSNMPIVYGGIQKTKNMPYAETVIAAQQKIAEERENCYFFKTSDLPLFDNWHFTGNAAFELGTRFAEQILKHYEMTGDYALNADGGDFEVNKYSTYSLLSKPAQANKTALSALVDSCTHTAESYTALSYAYYSDALSNARAVLNNGEATQTAVDEVVTALSAAIEKLIAVFDKTVLEDLLLAAKALEGGTAVSHARLDAAIAQAEGVLKNEKITYALGETVKAELLKAMESFEDIPENSEENNSSVESADNQTDEKTTSESTGEEKSGCGSVIGTAVAGITLAGAAVLALKKKED